MVDLVVPRIHAPAASRPPFSAGGHAPGSDAGDHATAEVVSAAAIASPVRATLAGGALALMLGLLLVTGWRAGTLDRLRARTAERVARVRATAERRLD
jgi:hypothetical protein